MPDIFVKLTDFPVADTDANYYLKFDGGSGDDNYIFLPLGTLQVLACVDGESNVAITADDRVQERIQDTDPTPPFFPPLSSSTRGECVIVPDMVTCIKVPGGNICTLRARIRR